MAQNGYLPDNLLRFQNNNLGTFEKLGPDTPTLTIKTLNELYWVLGDMTFCERATMLANVCSPNNRNIRMVKRLAEINLVKGDYAATRKYLRILQKTFVWSRWANRAFSSLGRKQQPMKSPPAAIHRKASVHQPEGYATTERELPHHHVRTGRK